ncbi:MAG: hypothetical protein ACT4TC_17300 [Myxococcaceae bacterium]
MKRQRPSRKSTKPPPARTAAPEAGLLQYKVVELSNVDEAALERAVNEWVRKGWTLENVQFAMRESSKRPAMAFVFFTRVGEALEDPDPEQARSRLLRLAHESAPPRVSAYERLAQLAAEGDEPE